MDSAKSCDQVTFSRNLKYGENDLNVLDVATGDFRDATPRPVLLYVAGENFGGGVTTGAAGNGQDKALQDKTLSVQDKAMCFAARNGMVGVSMTYRLAPAAGWPAGARDVAAAASWIHQNIDLFKGNAQEIVAIGYAAGAFHVASFLAHTELQEADFDVAGAVLVSRIYRSGPTPARTRSHISATTPARTTKDRRFPAFSSSSCRSCSPGRCRTRRVSWRKVRGSRRCCATPSIARARKYSANATTAPGLGVRPR